MIIVIVDDKVLKVSMFPHRTLYPLPLVRL